MSFQEVRVRFAPSPTGYLHVGGARTALYNYLYAKKHGGKFILRVEDTDQARSTEESLKMVLEDLQWLGLKWDEGPHPSTLEAMGPFGPYKQSERLSIYKNVAEELLQKGAAYYCFLTDEEIDAQRALAKAQGRPPHVESPYESWSLEKSLAKIAEGGQAVVRFKTRALKKDYVLNDLIRGEVRFPSDMVGDFVLLRSGGMPVYNFCCAVDDHMMKISHVLRAEEHLPNTLRQMMIYEAMHWVTPAFGHLSLILDEDRQKLSKRKGATSCHEFKLEGYLPEALLNFVALLGWSHANGKEVLTMDEMISGFDLGRANPAGAIFDAVKLKWMNAQHLRNLPSAEIWKQIAPFLQNAGLELSSDPAWQEQSVDVFKSAMETLNDAVELYRPLSDKSFTIHDEASEVFTWESSKAVLAAWKELVEQENSEFMTEERFLKLQDLVKEKAQVKGKFLFMPIRVAVIGKPHGAELKILVPLMSKKSLLARVNQCLGKL
ncbi:MAG: glutamate--tRNA ligase [Bdellovibrio sp. CG10_big_fil_rev_8_21_14_0_10_47_8]|nr:MAG: glutamate--tRNA ligase [Bdellovibrio sp. CG10_big_fil_rev_8_21_14_0_10_47_8]